MAAKQYLKILIHPTLDTEELRAELSGHDIEVMEVDTADYDLVLGPNCWRAMPTLTKFIKTAVTAAKNTKKRRAKK